MGICESLKYQVKRAFWWIYVVCACVFDAGAITRTNLYITDSGKTKICKKCNLEHILKLSYIAEIFLGTLYKNGYKGGDGV